MYVESQSRPDQPPVVVEGQRYAETADLAVKDLVSPLRESVVASLGKLKAAGTIPAGVRAFVSYEGPAYCASLNVRIAAPRAWAHETDGFGAVHVSGAASRLVAEIEALRQAFNREARNTPADGCRYYGSTWTEAR